MKLSKSFSLAIFALLVSSSVATKLRGALNLRSEEPGWAKVADGRNLAPSSCDNPPIADGAIVLLSAFQESGIQCSDNLGDVNDLVDNVKDYYTVRKNVGKLAGEIRGAISKLSEFIESVKPI